MKREEVRTNRKFILIVLVLLIVIMLVGVFAQYMTAIKAKGDAYVAVWHFDVKANGEALSSGEINFEDTIECEGNSVEGKKLAPGTSGMFSIEVDTSGTEVLTQYDIKIDLVDCPKNMKFWFQDESGDVIEYLDREVIKEETINEVTIKTEELKFTRYVDLDEHDIHNEDIYWEWPFETGETDTDKLENNLDDTEWMARGSMKMNITAVGQQILEIPYLANLAKIGDYVSYNANINEQGEVETYAHKSGSIDDDGDDLEGCTVSEDFTTADLVQWRVLSVDKNTKEVTLMAADPIYQIGSTTNVKTVTLSGINGYKNAEDELNKIGSIYGHGKGAVRGRSINMNDVMQYSNYDYTTYKNISITPNKKVGDTQEYTKGTFITGKKYVDEEGIEHEVVTGGKDNGNGTVKASTANPVTVIQTCYNTSSESKTRNSFTGKDAENGLNKYNMIFKKSTNITANKQNYWLASHCVSLHLSFCNFCVFMVKGGAAFRL